MSEKAAQKIRNLEEALLNQIAWNKSQDTAIMFLITVAYSSVANIGGTSAAQGFVAQLNELGIKVRMNLKGQLVFGEEDKCAVIH